MHLFDMHCHLELMANGEDVAQQAKSCELTLLDTGVLPSEFETEQRRHASNDSVYVACGLHPWWVTDTLKDSEIEQLIERARSYPLIGEVGVFFQSMPYSRHQTCSTFWRPTVLANRQMSSSIGFPAQARTSRERASSVATSQSMNVCFKAAEGAPMPHR